MAAITTDATIVAREKSNWNFPHLALALLFGLVTQQVFLVCLCNIGEAKGKLGLIVLALIVLRSAVAYIRRERNKDWIIYAILAYTSAGWIEIVSRMALGPHD
jgi:hypothetical protein